MLAEISKNIFSVFPLINIVYGEIIEPAFQGLFDKSLICLNSGC